MKFFYGIDEFFDEMEEYLDKIYKIKPEKDLLKLCEIFYKYVSNKWILLIQTINRIRFFCNFFEIFNLKKLSFNFPIII